MPCRILDKTSNQRKSRWRWKCSPIPDHAQCVGYIYLIFLIFGLVIHKSRLCESSRPTGQIFWPELHISRYRHRGGGIRSEFLPPLERRAFIPISRFVVAFPGKSACANRQIRRAIYGAKRPFRCSAKDGRRSGRFAIADSASEFRKRWTAEYSHPTFQIWAKQKCRCCAIGGGIQPYFRPPLTHRLLFPIFVCSRSPKKLHARLIAPDES